MRKVFENRTVGTRDTGRVVRLYTGGIREVVKGDWDGEWWNRYVIIPRRLVINEIRRLRTEGCNFHLDFWEVLPAGACELIRVEHNIGPGCSYANRPFRINSSKKFIVICQFGGLDI